VAQPRHAVTYDYWQYWRNTEDADVGRFLKLFTTCRWTRSPGSNARRGGDQRGQEGAGDRGDGAGARPRGARAAEATARRTFEEGAVGEGLPTIDKTRSELETGISLAGLFVEAGLAASNGEVRRAIANNAVSINDVPRSTTRAAW
jgi:tyrosyl-tRNA synthetase